jgi:hypothetical protein
MRRLAASVLSAFAFLIGSSGAEAKLEVVVDKSTQQMWVMIDGQVHHVWRVSTGRYRHGTPNGIYRPERLARVWHSRAYYQSPMPHSIFFHNGYAIHGSYAISQLGGPASHGCVRLHPQHAAVLFGLVQQEGADNTSIVVTGANPVRPWQVAYRDRDRLVGPVVERPPERLRIAPRPADLPMVPWRPPTGDPVDVADGRSDPRTVRVPRVPQPEEIDAIDARDDRSLMRPPRLRREPRETIERRPNPGNSRAAAPPVGAKRESSKPSSSPPRAATEGTAGRPPAVTEPASPPPVRQPVEQNSDPDPAISSQSGYKLLPKSYWSGAAWRWR